MVRKHTYSTTRIAIASPRVMLRGPDSRAYIGLLLLLSWKIVPAPTRTHYTRTRIHAHGLIRTLEYIYMCIYIFYVRACGEHSCQAAEHQKARATTPAGAFVFCLHRRHAFKGGKPIVILHVRKEPAAAANGIHSRASSRALIHIYTHRHTHVYIFIVLYIRIWRSY